MTGTADWVREELELRQADGLRRREDLLRPGPGGWRDAEGRTFLNFSTNDYLGLSRHPEIMAAASRAALEYGAGAGASRLVTGTRPVHVELEQAVARLKGYPAARVFGSGMMVATGVIPALFDGSCEVFADRLSHACLLDGCLLSGARLRRFRHNDAEHLGQLLANAEPDSRKLVVTESVFSMDGDVAPLSDIASVSTAAGADLMVDEAHATGVWGPGGAGFVSELGLQAQVSLSMGTFSKALGSQGGFICCSELYADWFIHAARTYIFTTAPAPAVAGASLAAVQLLQREPGLGQAVRQSADRLRLRLTELGFHIGASRTQIIPVHVGDNEAALRIARSLRSRDILAPAIRPPTVPEGTARIRLGVCLDHSQEDLDRLVAALCSAFAECGVAR